MLLSKKMYSSLVTFELCFNKAHMDITSQFLYESICLLEDKTIVFRTIMYVFSRITQNLQLEIWYYFHSYALWGLN